MAADEKWYFTKEQLMSAPSRKYGYDADKELSCRQQAANFIQDMGQRLQVTQLCINTAIVYMHRFYMFHSFTQFHRNQMAAAALFLAAKVEEQPRKLEHVIKVSQICLHRDMAPPDVKSPAYNEQAQELVVNENILLQTLGFDVAIDHPHTHVVRCCHLVRASKDLAQTSYFMASNSLHLTTMCLQYKPTVVACFCIHLACKWSNWEIPQSTEGKPWFWYIDKTVSQELLEQLTEEFLGIFDKCPSRLKKKIVSLSQSQNPTILSQFNDVRHSKDDKKRNGDGSLSGTVSGSSSSSEDMKKKAEFQRHHPPDYKKHHMSHHSRPDPLNVSSKSSCMFGPPQRTQPSSHSIVSSSHPSRSIQKTSVPDVNNLGKPEHLHHRPRRPDDKHPRNHEHIPSQYKKFDNKVPSGVVNEFPQTGPVSSRSAVNFNTSAPSNYQMAPQPAQLPMHPPVSAIPEQTMKDTLPLLPSVPKPVAPLPPKTKVVSPPPVKIERSIFSPEKCTPPPESLVKPLPPSPPPVSIPTHMNYMQKVTHIKEEYIVPKQESIASVEVKQEISISPKEEKPPDLLDVIEEPVAIKIEPIPSLTTPSQSILPSEEPHTHKEKKEKKKKKHKEHKEHKDKHKDKHKHKHKNREPEPIVITIPKEKLTLPPLEQGLKIKIARDKITGPVESPLKIKISQKKIKESKKRDRSEERSPGLPAKYHRPNGTTTLQVNNELDILECSSVKPVDNVSVEVHSPPSICLDDIETIIDELPLSPPVVSDSSNTVDSPKDLAQDDIEEVLNLPPEPSEKPNMADSYSGGPPRGGYHESFNYSQNERSSKFPYDRRANVNLAHRGNYRGVRGDYHGGRGEYRGGFRGGRGGYREYPNRMWAPRPPRPPVNHYSSRRGYIVQPPRPMPPRHRHPQPSQRFFHPQTIHQPPPQFQPQQHQFYQHQTQPTYYAQYSPPPPLPDEPPPAIPPPPPPE